MIAAIAINLRFIRLGFSRCDRSHFTGLLSFSIWTFLSSGGLLIFTYADTILIGIFMTEADVGIYRVAFQLTSVASFMVIALHTVLFPRISKWHAENELKKIENSLTQAFTYSLFLAVPVAAGGIILSDKLLYFLYGAVFEVGVPALIILLFAQTANIFMYLQTMCLNAMDKPRTSFYITAVSAVVNIILNVLLIPIFGISGAAVASLITMMMNAGLSYVMLKSLVHVRINTKSILNLIIAAFIMSGFILVYIHISPIQNFIGLVLILALGALIYLVTVLGIDRSIRNDLKGLLHTMNFPIIQ